MTKDELEQDNFDPFQPLGLAAERLVKSLDVSESAKLPQLGGTIGSRSFFSGIEATNNDALSFGSERCTPLPTTSLKENPHEPAAISDRSPVSHVLRAGRLSEVCETIIGGVTIDVIDNVGRPNSVDMEPYQPVSEIVLFMDHDAPPAPLIEVSGRHTDKVRQMVSGSRLPEHLTSLGYIVDQTPDLLSINNPLPIGIVGHAARVLVKLGEDHQETGERESSAQHTEEQKAEEKRRRIDQGLRDIAAFEQRASGKAVRIRRKGK